MSWQMLDIDLIGRNISGDGLLRQLARGAHDLVAPAIIEGDDQVDRAISRRQRFGFLKQSRYIGLKVVAVADDPHAHAVLM